MIYWTFVAIISNGEHIVMSGIAVNTDHANRCLHYGVRSKLRGLNIKRFWYMLGDGHEAQEYTPEEVAEVFFGQ